MLVGEELLALVKSNPDTNQMDLARAAGYVRETKKGKEQVLVKRFYGALLAAQGVSIAVGKAPGKIPQYVTTVHRSGVILLGQTYSKRFGLAPGDELEIVMTDDCIKLVPTPAKAAVSPSVKPASPDLAKALAA